LRSGNRYVPGPELCPVAGVERPNQGWEASVFRWAVICLLVSIIAGGLGLTNISGVAKRLSIIFFTLFFLGFLALLGLAYLVAGAVSHSELMPALVAVSV
jgi:uncharacterized membrane protein YtjA (UPF0391 family)